MNDPRQARGGRGMFPVERELIFLAVLNESRRFFRRLFMSTQQFVLSPFRFIFPEVKGNVGKVNENRQTSSVEPVTNFTGFRR